MRDSISIREAAGQLGVTERRVRQLVPTGSLTRDELARLARRETKVGRKTARDSLQALADLLDFRPTNDVPPRTLSRLKGTIRLADSYEIAQLLAPVRDSPSGELARKALASENWLEQRKTLAELAKRQKAWEALHPDARVGDTSRIRSGARTASGLARELIEALSDSDTEYMLRHLLHATANWSHESATQLPALFRREPQRVPRPEWDAFLCACVEWSCAQVGVTPPRWTARSHCQISWSPIAVGFIRPEKRHPFFEERNIVISRDDAPQVRGS